MIQQLRRLALTGLIALVAVSFAAVTTFAQTQTAPAAPAQTTEQKPAQAPAKKASKKKAAKPAKKAKKAKTAEKKEEAPAKPKQ
jgi:hypothetical protein